MANEGSYPNLAICRRGYAYHPTLKRRVIANMVRLEELLYLDEELDALDLSAKSRGPVNFRTLGKKYYWASLVSEKIKKKVKKGENQVLVKYRFCATIFTRKETQACTSAMCVKSKGVQTGA